MLVQCFCAKPRPWLLEGKTTVHLGIRPVVGSRQTMQELLTNRLELRATEVTEQFHTIEARSPGVDHLLLSRTAERELLILDCQNLRDRESGTLQVTGEPSVHMEVVAACDQGVPGIVVE